MLAEPTRGSGGPSMTEAVTQAHIAPGAAVGMDVEILLRNDFVNPGGVLSIIEIEILPECGGAEIQHPAPVGLDKVHRLGIPAALGEGLQEIIAHERGKLLRTVAQDDGRCFLRIQHSLDGQEGRCLAVPDRVRNIGPEPFGNLGAFCLQGAVLQVSGHIGARFQGPDRKCLQAGVNHVRPVVGRPVDEASVGIGLAVILNILHYRMQELRHVFLLLLQVGLVSIPLIQVMLQDNPPKRIGADAVHPVRRGGLVPHIVQAPTDDLLVAEDRIHGNHLRMHVADPDQPVTLDAVPQVVLHAQMHGIGPRLPDLVQTLVITFERTQIRKVPLSGYGPDGPQGHLPAVRFEQFQPGETETAVAVFGHAQPGNADFHVPDGMVVGRRRLRIVDVAEGFAHGFAQDQAEPRRLVGTVDGANDLDAALEFRSEVQQEHPAFLHPDHLVLTGGHLPAVRLQEHIGPLHRPLRKHHPRRGHIFRHKAGIQHAGGFD